MWQISGADFMYRFIYWHKYWIKCNLGHHTSETGTVIQVISMITRKIEETFIFSKHLWENASLLNAVYSWCVTPHNGQGAFRITLIYLSPCIWTTQKVYMIQLPECPFTLLIKLGFILWYDVNSGVRIFFLYIVVLYIFTSAVSPQCLLNAHFWAAKSVRSPSHLTWLVQMITWWTATSK